MIAIIVIIIVLLFLLFHDEYPDTTQTTVYQPIERRKQLPIKRTDVELYRQHAKKCEAKRRECVRLSYDAIKRRNFRQSERYSDEAEKWKLQMNATNKRAAEEAFRSNNVRRHVSEIDLHDLFVNEAIEMLTKRILKLMQQGGRKLIVIVGRGLHSINGPKIKPAVIDLAIDWGITTSILLALAAYYYTCEYIFSYKNSKQNALFQFNERHREQNSFY